MQRSTSSLLVGCCLALLAGCGTTPSQRAASNDGGSSGSAGMVDEGSTLGGGGWGGALVTGGGGSGGVAGKASASGGGAGTAGTTALGGSGGSDVSTGGVGEPPNCVVPHSPESVTKVACVGDSITRGYGASDPSHSYPSQLGELLGGEYDVGNFGADATNMTKNGSFPYWNQAQFADAQAFLPNVVVLGLGTNDMGTGSYADLPDFPADYAAMVDVFRGLASEPIVFAVIPIWVKDDNPGNGYTNARLAEVIDMIYGVADEKSLCVIDLNTPFVNHPELYYDGIHPNDAGYALMASSICAAIGEGCAP